MRVHPQRQRRYVCDGSNDQVNIPRSDRGGEVVLTEDTSARRHDRRQGQPILQGPEAGQTVLSMAGDYAARVDIAQPGVTVSDLEITNRGWLMITTSNVKVHDVTIQDSKKTAPTVNGMFFVWADGKVCENIEFVRCQAIDVGSTGFNLNGQKSPRVTRISSSRTASRSGAATRARARCGPSGSTSTRARTSTTSYVLNCRAEDCWESGFYFEPNFHNRADPNQAIPVQENSRDELRLHRKRLSEHRRHRFY